MKFFAVLGMSFALAGCLSASEDGAPRAVFPVLVEPSATPEPPRDTDPPLAPVVTQPEATRVISNQSEFLVEGGCESGDVVVLSGAATAEARCVEDRFSFLVIAQEDGERVYALVARDAAGNSSAQVSVIWVRDTVAPPAPQVLVPAQSRVVSTGELTVSGLCEKGASVRLAGSVSAETPCDEGFFELKLREEMDGTFPLIFSQLDQAGNFSETAERTWVVDATVPAAPALREPLDSVTLNNNSALGVAGDCALGATVILRDEEGEQVSPCLESRFSFHVEKVTDGTYAFGVFQVSEAGLISSEVAFTWIRDTSAPGVELREKPQSPHLMNQARLTFETSEAGSTLFCRLDSAAFAPCSSPVSFANLANGLHAFEVYAIDDARNVSAVQRHEWRQEVYQTLALYHFDAVSGGLVDSSLYTERGDLVNHGTTQGAFTRFAETRKFAATGAQFAEATDRASLRGPNDQMTFETFIRLTTMPSSSGMVVASKSGSTGNYGWEIRLKKQGSKNYLFFMGSLDGVERVTVRSGALSFNTSAFHHLAITWDRGVVKFFWNGSPVGAGNIGISGSAQLYPSAAPLLLGRGVNGEYLDATLDEVRLSQVVRFNSSFTPPVAAYAPD